MPPLAILGAGYSYIYIYIYITECHLTKDESYSIIKINNFNLLYVLTDF